MNKLQTLLTFITVPILLSFSNITIATSLQDFIKTKPYLESKDFNITIPIEVWETKVYLFAKVNGKSYRFILDTGSPTILTKKVAEALNLEIKGENTGKDANGNLVKMDLSVLDSLKIGELTIRNIPVFIFDPTNLPLGDCILDGGVIGSEILPLATWQVNTQELQMSITDDASQLKYLADAKKAKLKIFGYPFTPIVAHSLNDEFTDNAMFDTGSTELLHLNKLAYEELKRRKLVSSVDSAAIGTFGESAGGRGPDTKFNLVPINKLSIGSVEFKDIKVWTRHEPPSLIGARIFESHIVTFDYPSHTVYFYQTQSQVPVKSFGFKPYLKNGAYHIGFLDQSSKLAKEGVNLHDQIVRVNDLELSNIDNDEQCEIHKLLATHLNSEELKITIKAGQSTRTLVLKRN